MKRHGPYSPARERKRGHGAGRNISSVTLVTRPMTIPGLNECNEYAMTEVAEAAALGALDEEARAVMFTPAVAVLAIDTRLEPSAY